MSERHVNRYILDKWGDAVPEPDFTAWHRWCKEQKESLAIHRTLIEGTKSTFEIVTEFLTFNRNPEGERPALFKASVKILSGAYAGRDVPPVYFSNRAEADIGHYDAVFAAKEMQREFEGK